MLSSIDPGKFGTLIEISSLINSDHEDVHALLARIIEAAARLCQGEAASLLLLDQEKQELYFEVALGVKAEEAKKYTIKPGEGIAGWVAAHNKSIIVNDVENDSRHAKRLARKIGYDTHTILAAPMRLRDRCIGVIELLNKTDGKHFLQEDLEWLEIFANQAALALQNARSFARVEALAEGLGEQIRSGYHILVAQSSVTRELVEMTDRYAKTGSSVLIQGESGVGKELFAEQIHLRSSRREKPFIRVNCAAIPEGLLESELFGHIKGAFTGAVQDRRGRFEVADGGTLFLDEIGDMPLALQAKLLRVLQQKSFEKVGSDETVAVDVRIVAATNRDIERLVGQGLFRSDLYYRLNVLPLYVPPLRERPEDIPELASWFLKGMTKKTGRKIDGFSQDAMEAMIAFSWPGNIRELQNSVERACVLGTGTLIGLADLFPESAGVPGMAGNSAARGRGDRSLKNALNTFKTHYIKKVLEENGGNQTETAKALDIQRTYLSRLVKELGIARGSGWDPERSIYVGQQ